MALSLLCLIVAIIVLGDFFGMTVFNLKVMLILLAFIVVSVPLHIFIPKIVSKIESLRKKQPEKKKKFRKKAVHIDGTNINALHEDLDLENLKDLEEKED